MSSRRWRGLGVDGRRDAGRLVLFLLAAALIGRAVLAVAEPFGDLLAAFALTAFAWSVRPRDSADMGRREKWLSLAPFVALLLAALIAIRLLEGPVEVLVFALFLFGLELLRMPVAGGRRDVPAMGLTLLLYTVFLLLQDRVSYVDHGLRVAAEAVSHSASAFVPGALSIGPGYLGLPLVALFLLYALSLSVFAEVKSAAKLAATGACALLCVLVYAVAWGWASGYHPIIHNASLLQPFADAYDYRLLLFALLIVPIGAFRLTSPLVTVEARPDARIRVVAVALAAALAVSASLLMAHAGSGRQGRVVILDSAGNMATDLPSFEAFGLKQARQFGLLPVYLEGSGYDVEVVTKISPELLKRTGTLVLINLRKDFDARESRAIWDFVDAGGSLLVLGDHTGREQIRYPTNRLLEPVGISLNFDSAVPIRDGWANGFDLKSHPIGYGISQDEVQIQVGASLRVAPPARPVLVGLTGFSDAGNANNTIGFLGDMKHDPGEQMGDVVLAAEAVHGKGKVLVFGDTTFVQNPVTAYSYRFLDNAFSWLAERSDATVWLTVSEVAAGVLAVAAGVIAICAGAGMCVTALPAAALALALLVSGVAARPATHDWTRGKAGRPRAVVDVSHLELGRSDSSLEAVNGLVVNLVRNGYTPFLMREFSREMIDGSESLILPSPMEPFTPAEVGAIEAFAERGGLVVLTVGADKPEGARPLLDRLGFGLRAVPLGKQVFESKRWNVGLWGAWPLEDTRGGAEVIAKVFDYPVAMYRRQGAGGVLVVADPAFLMNKNLEDVNEGNPDNIRFLRDFFKTYGKGGGGDS